MSVFVSQSCLCKSAQHGKEISAEVDAKHLWCLLNVCMKMFDWSCQIPQKNPKTQLFRNNQILQTSLVSSVAQLLACSKRDFIHRSVFSHVPLSVFLPPARRSSETLNSFVWCGFYAAPWWCGWEEAGWLSMSSWWRTTPVEVSSKVHHKKSQCRAFCLKSTSVVIYVSVTVCGGI